MRGLKSKFEASLTYMCLCLKQIKVRLNWPWPRADGLRSQNWRVLVTALFSSTHPVHSPYTHSWHTQYSHHKASVSCYLLNPPPSHPYSPPT